MRRLVHGRSTLIPLVVILLLSGVPAWGSHEIFHFTFDRFELDGNVFGPNDGIPEVVDEFDDGSLLPRWNVYTGTAYEEGGLLHLTNPGTHFEFLGISMEKSDIIGRNFGVFKGSGDFTATGVWNPDPLEVNDAIFFGVFSPEAFGVAIANWPARGYVLHQSYSHCCGLPDYLESQDSPIDAEAITGPVIFKIHYNDAASEVSTEISLDGGLTFRRPFKPHPFFQVFTMATFGFFADPRNTAEPVAGSKLLLKREPSGAEKAVFLSRDKNVAAPWENAGNDPGLVGATMELCSGTGERASFDLPAAGWQVGHPDGKIYRFGNESVASDVQVALIKLGRRIKVVAKSAGLSLSGPQGQVGVRVTTGTSRHCALFSGSAIVADEPGKFRARGAEAAAVADCSDEALGCTPQP